MFATLEGIPGSRFQDPYHLLLTISWWRFLGMTALIYLFVNTLFATLYLLHPGGITNTRADSFWDAFFFSAQTLGTMGYGVMAPAGRYANTISTIESFTGMLGLAQITGVIFARFSRPTARLMFSDHAVITPHDGMPSLMIRAANQRGNQMLEAEVSMTLVSNRVTSEGILMRGFSDLKVVRAKSPVFSLSWTVIHHITKDSPLYGHTPESLAILDPLIIVIISGTDENYSQKVYARRGYSRHDMLWNHHFTDIISMDAEGHRVVNIGNLDSVAPDPVRSIRQVPMPDPVADGGPGSDAEPDLPTQA